MTIRRFNKEDAPRVSELICSALDINNSKDYGQDVLLNMKKEYTPANLWKISQSRSFLVMEIEDVIVGVGGIEGNHISCVFVHPDSQGKGVGRRIMNELESIAKKNNYAFVCLHSSLTAKSFYAEISYSEEKHLDDPYYGENIFMKKRLL